MNNNLEGENKKGALIKKKKNTLQRPEPVRIVEKNPFKFTPEKPLKPAEKLSEETEKPIEAQKQIQKKTFEANVSPNNNKAKKTALGKKSVVKSIKVPEELHTQINILGKFMDEKKVYAIIEEMMAYYVSNALTDRQKKQFEFMSNFLNQDEKSL